MADLETNLCGVRLKSPFVLASGPLSHDGRGLIVASEAGAGAVVTKTISRVKADNPLPHMAKAGRDTLINCEEWSDVEAGDWIGREIAVAREGGAVVIASVGLSPDDVAELVAPVAKAGPHLVEVVSYSEESIVAMVREARKRVGVPVLAKVSPNWPTVVKTAVDCVKAGADGITATDSFGPALRIDVATAKPLMGGPFGYGWLSGAALKPIVLRIVSEIARATHDVPIIGTGGVARGEDALEMLMAGASAVGVCTTPILQGVKIFRRLNRDLAGLLERYGYAHPAAATGAALPNLVDVKSKDELCFEYAADECNECGLCVNLCPYGARKMAGKAMAVDSERCRYCGLCASVCPTGALGISGGLRNHRQ
ncbi:MAG: 4Fe-4S dicluster domain-containing protein [Bacillota bacterium]|nr:MAG: 4Fe-4S dicluster domain-containing protein [Bacillota bacterium]